MTEKWAWFNHATFGPPLRAYLRAVREFTEKMAAADLPDGYGLWGEMVDGVAPARRAS